MSICNKVTLETGKLLASGISEVQGFIDFCDYAAGISRSLGGRVLPSEGTASYQSLGPVPIPYTVPIRPWPGCLGALEPSGCGWGHYCVQLSSVRIWTDACNGTGVWQHSDMVN